MPFEIGPAIEASKRKAAEMATWSVDQWMFYCLQENVTAMKHVKEGRDAHWREKLHQVIEDDDSSLEQQATPTSNGHSKPKPAPAGPSRRKPKRARRGGVGLLTIQQAADRLGVHYQTIRNWIKSEKLAAFQRGAVVLIPEEALTEYQGGQKHGETGQKRPGQKWRGDTLSA